MADQTYDSKKNAKKSSIRYALLADLTSDSKANNTFERDGIADQTYGFKANTRQSSFRYASSADQKSDSKANPPESDIRPCRNGWSNL